MLEWPFAAAICRAASTVAVKPALFSVKRERGCMHNCMPVANDFVNSAHLSGLLHQMH